jgi:hypothetical protein
VKIQNPCRGLVIVDYTKKETILVEDWEMLKAKKLETMVKTVSEGGDHKNNCAVDDEKRKC